MPDVFVAGATGYLGRYLCAEYRKRGWHVRALVRDAERAQDLEADELIVAEATRPHTLCSTMNGVELVVSALGITRQSDGLSYRDVDYQANLNLLAEAQRASVRRFTYIHVLNAAVMPDVPLVAAKMAFVQALQSSEVPATVIAPTGYFSDMGDFLKMAQSGRVWMFGSGTHCINPIHGADLAVVAADAAAAEEEWVDVGGPDIFSQSDLAMAAFAALGKPARITRLPDWLRRAALLLLPRLTPRRIHGPAQFFLTALGQDMVATPYGRRHLATHFAELARTHAV
jgi:uncharacterized protein YbjT (DUF2867 family)